MFCVRCHRHLEADHLYCPHDGEPLVQEPSIEMFRGKPTKQMGLILGSRYEVRGFIGKGAMARVYLAEDLTTSQPVAVKVLDKAHVKNDRLHERFVREARAATSIGHPNIVKLFDIGLGADGAPYLVMEFLFGESLGDWLRREKVMSPAVGLPIVLQVASGLSAAHHARIIHRDVKPDNIFLVGEPGSPYAVKIVDFGFAKLEVEGTSTQTGVAVGTIEYMAPEQAVSDRTDRRTDVYGLGAVMYRMFTGHLPFEAKEEVLLLAHQLAVTPVLPRDRAPELDLDPRIEAVIVKAMRKRRESRYKSMDAFAEDVERLLGQSADDLAADGEAPADDTFIPESPFAISAARFLYRKLGKTPPAW
jgi:eukaryotic-like serine/threonine-protein kinase